MLIKTKYINSHVKNVKLFNISLCTFHLPHANEFRNNQDS